MIKNLTTALLLLFTVSAFSQSYNSPESMIYDEANDRYFVSNVNGNTIFSLSTNGELSNYVTEGLNGPKALLICGDTLLSMNHTSVQGFLLSDTSKVMQIDVSESQFMNGAALDNKGNLFVTDMQKHCVYRINLKKGTYNIFTDGLNSPNGLHFDEANNRLLVVSWGSNAKIQAINLNDSVLSDVVTTKMSDLDGICSDNCGNIYVSSWGKNAVFVYEPTFTKAPTKIAESLSGPADISIREDNQTLLVPKFNANAVEIIDLGMNCAETTSNVSPANESANLATTVTVEWQAIEGATGYVVEYGTDDMFYRTEGFVMTTDLSADLEDLDPATTYFWRVAVGKDDTKTYFSEPWSFTTAEESVSTQSTNFDQLKVYPNPVKNTLYIDNVAENSSIQIFDLMGKSVYYNVVTGTKLQLPFNFNNGLYLVKVSNGISEKSMIICKD